MTARPHGTSYSRVKAAIVARLTAGSLPAQGVHVSYQAPDNVPEVRGAGTWESVHLDAAEGAFEPRVFMGTPLVFDEDYVVSLVIQALRPTKQGTQQAADRRVEEILYTVLDEIAGQTEWNSADLELDEFEWLEVTPATQEWHTGLLGGTPGHGASVELGLRVQARRRFDQ